MDNAHNVLLTGAAGVGKSHLLKVIIERLRALHPTEGAVAVCAPTGIAALNVGGVTIHSFAGIGLGRGTAEDLFRKLGAAAKGRWTSVVVLVIDEVSMLDNVLIDKLDHIARLCRPQKKSLPFAQVVISASCLPSVWAILARNSASTRRCGERRPCRPSS